MKRQIKYILFESSNEFMIILNLISSQIEIQ